MNSFTSSSPSTMLSLTTHPFFLLRRPLLSLDSLESFHTANQQPDQFREAIKALFSQPVMQEAIYVASPDLYGNFNKLLRNDYTGDSDKLLQSLYKYYLRMTTRCTPYGLFAGYAVGRSGADTAIHFPASDPWQKKARLDMNYVAELVQHLLADVHIRQQIRFSPNSMLYKLGDRYRYVEAYLKNKHRHYTLTSVVANQYLDAVLERASTGALITHLAAWLIDRGIAPDEATAYIEQLIDAQLLVSELEPTVTGDDFVTLLTQKLNQFDGADAYVDALHHINALLARQDHSIARYDEILQTIRQRFSHTSSKDLVQIDLSFNTTACQLGNRLTTVLTSELSDLAFIGKSYKKGHLEQFCRRFSQRYEEGEVPLLVALDSETGIGYGQSVAGKADYLPLLDDLSLPRDQSEPSVDWTDIDRLRLRLYETSQGHEKRIVTITDEDIEQAKAKQTPALARSLFVMGNLLAESAEAADQNAFKFVITTVSGPSAGRLLGRFCQGNPALEACVKEALLDEAQEMPDAIYAEIAHLPEARTGNILIRPALREYEIPFLAGSSLPPDQQLPLSDLMVSVRNGDEVVLRSKKLNKRIIPRLSTAHNFTRGLSIYRFLCDLQLQKTNYDINWDWGILADKPFLPRVEYKHLIVSRATWNLKPTDYAALINTPDSIAALRQWQQQRQIPDQVLLADGDNELLIDFRHPVSGQILLDRFRKNQPVRLVEFLFDKTHRFLRDDQGQSFTNELIIPLKLTRVEPRPSPVRSMPGMARRTFAPGSEWLYVKLFTGTKTADRLLTEVIKPLTETLLQEGFIDQWFFIRYNDPTEHLRIRFHHATNPLFWQTVLARLHDILGEWIEKGLVHSLQIDTYQRELERYGAGSIHLSEQFFFHDSVAAVNFLDLLHGEKSESYRWLFAMRGADDLLTAFGYDTEAKQQLIERLRTAFFREFGGNTKLTVNLNTKYREVQSFIRTHMDVANDPKNGIGRGTTVFADRQQHLILLAGEIWETSRLSGNSLPLDRLMGSYLHMFLNRLFIAKPRVQEMVIYHYLAKYYETKVAMQRKRLVNA